MQLDLGNGPVELEVSFWTLVVYETQFGSDMIGDLFGKVTATRDELEEPDASEDTFTIDYTSYDWNAGVRAMWAAVKAADRNAPAYEQWCRSMTDVNMWPLMEELKSEVLARLFRTGAAASE